MSEVQRFHIVESNPLLAVKITDTPNAFEIYIKTKTLGVSRIDGLQLELSASENYIK